jgi:hypothetical protein
MTPEQQQQYLDELTARKGEGLEGLEAKTYGKAIEATQQVERGRTALQKAEGELEKLRATVQQLEGRHRGFLDLLIECEQDRRKAKANGSKPVEPEAEEPEKTEEDQTECSA